VSKNAIKHGFTRELDALASLLKQQQAFLDELSPWNASDERASDMGAK